MTNKKGLTLVELMMALAIFTMIMAGLWRMVRGGTMTFMRAQQQAEVIDSGERAMRGYPRNQGMFRDIRQAAGVKAAQADRLTLTGPAGDIQYYRNGNNLVKVVTGSTATVAGNITALSFRYFTIQGGLVSLTTVPQLANAVEVRLHVKKGETDYDLVSSARFRNKL